MIGKYAENLKNQDEMINFSSNRLVPIEARTARFGESDNNKTELNSPWKLGPGIIYSKAYQ